MNEKPSAVSGQTGMKINPTLTKGAAKVPMVMQLEALECGAAALCMVMAYYGKWVPLEQVRLDCGISRDGSNAKNIYLAAENYGFKVTAYRMEPESLRDQGQFPCIIHWNMNHFVVLCGFRGKHAYMLLTQETATRAQVATILMRISEQQNRP